MATELGKFLRKLRIDNDELLKHMADRLGLASSTLSSIEAGRRKPPKGFTEKVAAEYRLDAHQVEELDRAAAQSQDEVAVHIAGLSQEDRKLAVAFARKFADLSDDQKASIREVLDEGD